LVLEAVQRWIEGSVRYCHASAGYELETMDERIAVKWLVGEGAHDEHVERSLEESGVGLGHI
jgi:hypothetical protein